MRVRRPAVAALMAFALAAVVLIGIVVDSFSLVQAMRDIGLLTSNALLPISEQFPVLDSLVPNVVLASLPVILCVALYAALWPFVSMSTGRPFMVAALVAALPAAIIPVLDVLLAPFVRPPGPEFLTGVFWLIRVSSGLLGLFLAIALRRSGLFSVWVTSLALAWAGLEVVIPLGIRMLGPLYGPYWLADTTGLVENYVSPVVLAMLLILLGLEMLALRGVSNKGIEQTAQASMLK